MENNEHAIILDVPGGKDGKYHSAILTTYAIDLIHFDNQLLNMLHRKRICSINVFADSNQMEKAMEYVNPIYMNNIGKDYCITSINAIKAFHPKINFFVGDEAVLVVFGTGNLTVTGHGKNHEAFTGFMIDKNNTSHQPLIEECWQYLINFTKQCGDFERYRILHDIPENCIFLESFFNIVPHKMHQVQEGLNAALLYNEQESSILQQISELVPLNDVVNVTVLSPYFDEYGESLVTLSQLCPNATVSVLINSKCPLPPCKIPSNKNIVFYDFYGTQRGKKSFSTYDRQQHAKILHFKTSDSEYCVVGSANATIAGLGTLSKRGVNEEFCVLYYSRKKDFLAQLGLKTKKELDVSVNKLSRYNNNKVENKNHIKLLSAQYDSGRLCIMCREKLSEGTQFAIDNGIDINEYSKYLYKDGKYEIETNLDKRSYTCYLIDKDKNRISNKIFINRTGFLAATNPSKMSRNINRLISRIENEGYYGLEIADILSDVMWSIVNDTEDNANIRHAVASKDEKNIDKLLPHLNYYSEYDNDDVKSNKTMQIDHTSRLIESIEESIRKKIRSINDAIIEEEEEGSAETSHDRNIEENEDILISKKHIKDYGDLSTSVLKKYQKMIRKRYQHVNSAGENTITKDDMNLFSLSIFAAMEICYLNRPNYKFDATDDISKSSCQKQFYDSLDSSINITAIDTVEQFLKFCNTMKGAVSQDASYQKAAFRTMKYIVLFGTLFRKYSNQEGKRIIGTRVINAIKNLKTVFGMPSKDLLLKELQSVSEKYNYVFRLKEVENLLSFI